MGYIEPDCTAQGVGGLGGGTGQNRTSLDLQTVE